MTGWQKPWASEGRPMGIPELTFSDHHDQQRISALLNEARG